MQAAKRNDTLNSTKCYAGSSNWSRQKKRLKEKPAEKQEAQYKNERVDYDFDKAHGFTILEKSTSCNK